MGKDWANRGFDDPDNLYGNSGGGGGGNSFDPNKKTFSFFVPDPTKQPGGQPITKRILFLDTIPFAFWEHSFYKITGKSRDKCICLGRNGLDERGCPLCDQEFWPAYAGYLTVIDMGTVIGTGQNMKLEGYQGKKDRVWQFDKKVICMKRGGDDKPGMLKKIERYRDKYGGDLTGTVWDVTRTGRLVEACGDEWDYVERVKPEEFAEYLVRAGAQRDQLDLQPCDYYEEYVPKPYEELARFVGGGGGASNGGGQTKTEGAGYGGNPDDDIPF